jgi:centromere-localized protein 2
MEKACQDLDAEIQELEKQLRKKVDALQAAVGELSDLRYGRFPKAAGGAGDLGQQTLEHLQRLQDVCKDLENPT